MPTSYFILNLCIFEIITLSKQINLTVLSRRGWVFKTCALDSWSVLKVCCLHVYFKFSWTDSDCVFRELSPMAATPVLMSILFIHQGSVSALLDSKLFWHNHIHQLQTPAQWMQENMEMQWKMVENIYQINYSCLKFKVVTRVRLNFVTIQNRILKLSQQNRVTPNPSPRV